MDAINMVNDVLVNLFNEIMEMEQKALITGEFSNITNNDMHIIEAVGTDVPKTMSALAKALKVTVGTLTIAMNSLVKKGYVNRERSEQDRRVVLISLSALGKRAYMHHKRYHENMVRTVLHGLSQEEVEVLMRALSNLHGYFREYGYREDKNG